ncbi:hypothetical protein CRN61_17745 [Vibrio vulnificus]|uniref:hypothetical protein n=1 Tax=Vibrio vulnificus TaxID=672 RepID=UPI000C9E9025|nr:hypothetical protein [Vibrio vulnificus]PNG65015.1 hypothetical protein SC81_07815 [Vibrio vulnificus]POC08148.1 hypothetical protein CRN54_16655 [Vibrio vulnificus]POC78035.1 hypothetical protein CRN61_17745 [Vibrio vulnificus]
MNDNFGTVIDDGTKEVSPSSTNGRHEFREVDLCASNGDRMLDPIDNGQNAWKNQAANSAGMALP